MRDLYYYGRSQVDSHETLANGVVVQVRRLVFEYFMAFNPISASGQRRTFQQRGTDETVHADLRPGAAEHQEVLRPQRHLPLSGRGIDQHYTTKTLMSFGCN